MMHGNAIWKPGIGEIVKASRGIARGPHKEGGGVELTASHMNPRCNGHCAATHWVIAYGHETQSFIKNGSQQKCLDKALTQTFALRPLIFKLQQEVSKFNNCVSLKFAENWSGNDFFKLGKLMFCECQFFSVWTI